MFAQAGTAMNAQEEKVTTFMSLTPVKGALMEESVVVLLC